MTRVIINHMESGARMLNLLYCYHVFASLVQRPVQTDACSQRAGSLAWPGPPYWRLPVSLEKR